MNSKMSYSSTEKELIYHVSNRISHRKFEYTAMDRSNLQTRYYNKVMRGGNRFMLHRIKKDHMIKLLLEEEFGKEAIKQYDDEVKDWNAYKWFCEN